MCQQDQNEIALLINPEKRMGATKKKADNEVTTVSIDRELMRELRARAVQLDKSYKQYLEELIRESFAAADKTRRRKT